MANYPVPYQNNWNYSGVGQQMYPQYQQSNLQQAQQAQAQPCTHGLIWVDGEVGAKAFQMPSGMPANQPIALWDTNDTVIYLKSVNQFGMPNPLQKAHYTLEEYRGTGPARSESSGAAQDLSEYVRKDDMDRMKQELMDAINSMNTSGTNAQARRPQKGEN